MRLARHLFLHRRVGSNDKQNLFLKKLEKLGYVVKAKEVKRIKISKSSYEWKGNLDVELAIDVLGNINNFDTLILMSGDSDFAPLFRRSKSSTQKNIGYVHKRTCFKRTFRSCEIY